jgi:carbon-monoxide dehydrogenase medium subunit
MKNFEYRKVSTLLEAFGLLEDYGGRGRLFAGGTDLLVKMRHGLLNPQILIDLKGIAELDRIQHDPVSGLRLGALTSIHRLETSSLLKEKFGVIAHAAASLGSYQIRCRATLGGNLCNASPAADMPPVLISLKAKVKIVSFQGERYLPLQDFFIGPGKPNIRGNEIMTEVQVPTPLEHTASHYVKHSIRNALDLAVAGVAVTLSMGADRLTCATAIIALGAVGPFPARASRAEEILQGRKIDDGLISRAALLASEETQPISDIRASAGYRREMVRILTGRALRQVWASLTEGRTPS